MKYKLFSRYLFLFLLIFYGLFVFFYNIHSKSVLEQEMKQHAMIIEREVWSLETDDTMAYLTLAANRDNYSQITIKGLPGDEFLSIKGPELSGIDFILDQIGLIPNSIIIAEVIHDGLVIAKLHGDHRNMNVYVYFYVLILFSLIYFVVMLYFKTIDAKRQVEVKVIEQTAVLHNEIEERKQAQKAMQNSKEILEIIINNIPNQIFWKNCDLVYMGCNQHFADVTGMGSPENVAGKTDYEFGRKSDHADSYRECDQKVISSNEPIIDLEESFHNADGLEGTALTSKVPLHDENGEIFGLLGICTDITERIRTQKQLQQTQKMEAIGTLAGGIAHDFNNILGGIVGYTELAQDDVGEDNPVQKYLSEILKSSKRAKDLVRQILTFSRKGQEERKSIHLSAIVKEAAKLLRSTIPTTIEIIPRIDETAGMVNADPTQMHQVVMNLCTNAAHAMQKSGGVLGIDLSSIEIKQESMRKYHDVSPGPFLQLKISDTGTGIDSRIINRVFEPFFTTKEKDKGTGMGLAVVHGIVKDHGGDIIVESQLGKGTTFTILLPRVIVAANIEEDTPSDVPTGSEHILFVDDEKTLTDLGKKMLESLGYAVTAKYSSIEALETFQQTPDTFDMVITDQTMPHMTGYDLAKRILKVKPTVPIILCTGYSNTVSPEKAEAAGIKALMYKPISKKEIARTVREVYDKHNHT